MKVNFNYVKRLVKQSIEDNLNLGHLLRAVCYKEFSYDVGSAEKLLTVWLRSNTKGFMRRCSLADIADVTAEYDLRKEYMIQFMMTCTLADKSVIHFRCLIHWDFRFNRIRRSVSVHHIN